jgi:hypothetical protein
MGYVISSTVLDFANAATPSMFLARMLWLRLKRVEVGGFTVV